MANGQGLDIIDAEVKNLVFLKNQKLKILHMGWNAVLATRANILLSSAREQRFFILCIHIKLFRAA